MRRSSAGAYQLDACRHECGAGFRARRIRAVRAPGSRRQESPAPWPPAGSGKRPRKDQMVASTCHKRAAQPAGLDREMGRPERTINATGPVPDFAQQLRLLRQEAGLTLRQLAARTGLSAATLSVAASGRELPTWKVTSAYVQACGADPEDWRVRWEHSARLSWRPRGPWAAGNRSELSGIHGQANGVVFPGGPAPRPVTAETTREFMACLRRGENVAGGPAGPPTGPRGA